MVACLEMVEDTCSSAPSDEMTETMPREQERVPPIFQRRNSGLDASASSLPCHGLAWHDRGRDCNQHWASPNDARWQLLGVLGEPHPLVPERPHKEIETLGNMLRDFPVSYNQMFMRGSLAYCKRALRRNFPHDQELETAIRAYIGMAAAMIVPYVREIPPTWSRLDLTVVEDKFALIENRCASLGVLPALDELTISDLAEE